MLDPDKLWNGHTPHTAETLHLPGIAAFFSGNEKFLKASQNVPGKLAYHTNPGGGFVAGKEMWEAIGGAMGGGDKADEYCAKTETLITLSRLFQYEGNTFSGDWGEHCALNAAQGARFHPANTASIYLSRDNRLSADKPDLHSGREMYSAGHRTAACCTLNATRLMPSYVEAMWYRCVDQPGLFANLYGASELTTTINKIPVRIVQETNYPFSDEITFRLEPKQPTSFDLVLRIPPNGGDIRVEADGVTVNRNDKSICISKNWKHGDTVNVDFDFQVVRQLQLDGKQAYYEWGPLVFSLPIKANIERWTEIERDGKKTGFYDYTITPVDKKRWATIDNTEASMRKIDLSDGDMKTPWAKPVIGLKGTLRTIKGDPLEVTLVPLGCTVLRRTTFPLNAEFARQAAEAHKGEFFSDEDDPMRDF